MGAGHLLHMMAGMFKQLAWTLCWIQFEGSGFLQSLSLLGSHVLSQQQALQPDCIQIASMPCMSMFTLCHGFHFRP
jgi:hypothetical protein